MSSQHLNNYISQLKVLHKELGVPKDYGEVCGLALQVECESLVETELDVFSRQPLMEAKAYKAWQTMKAAAQLEGIELQIISAFRSAEYQQGLLLNKLAKGQSLEEILKINVAPGYSEHHSGQAVDIGSPGYEHLSEGFEQSPAFSWLEKNAGNYGFFLSFPKDNVFGVLYEPWHWKFS